MTCRFCSGHIEHDEGWIDESGERIHLDGYDDGVFRDHSYAKVCFSHSDDMAHGFIDLQIKCDWDDDGIEFQIGDVKGTVPTDNEFESMYNLDIIYCPFCGEKLSARLDGDA